MIGIEANLEALQTEIGGEIVESASGIPNLVIPVGTKEASVGWFRKTRKYRIHYPRHERTREVVNFSKPSEIHEIVRALERS